MKYFSTLLALFMISYLPAQVSMVAEQSFDEVTTYASEVTIKAAPDRVIELWDEFWDDKYDVDVDREDRNREREIYTAKGVNVAAISDKQIDVYSKITTDLKGQATVSLGVGLGYEVFAGPDKYNEEFQATKDIMRQFETYFYRTHYGAQLDAAREAAEDLQDEVSDLENDLEKSDRRIERWTKKIEDEREETAENRETLNEAQRKLAKREATVTKMKQQLADWEE